MYFYLLNPYEFGWQYTKGTFVGPMVLRWWRSQKNTTIYIQPDWQEGRNFRKTFIAPQAWLDALKIKP